MGSAPHLCRSSRRGGSLSDPCLCASSIPWPPTAEENLALLSMRGFLPMPLRRKPERSVRVLRTRLDRGGTGAGESSHNATGPARSRSQSRSPTPPAGGSKSRLPSHGRDEPTAYAVSTPIIAQALTRAGIGGGAASKARWPPTPVPPEGVRPATRPQPHARRLYSRRQKRRPSAAGRQHRARSAGPAVHEGEEPGPYAHLTCATCSHLGPGCICFRLTAKAAEAKSP